MRDALLCSFTGEKTLLFYCILFAQFNRSHQYKPTQVPVFNDDEKAEVFNSYFSSVNVDDDGTLPDFPRTELKPVSISLMCSLAQRQNT